MVNLRSTNFYPTFKVLFITTGLCLTTLEHVKSIFRPSCSYDLCLYLFHTIPCLSDKLQPNGLVYFWLWFVPLDILVGHLHADSHSVSGAERIIRTNRLVG